MAPPAVADMRLSFLPHWCKDSKDASVDIVGALNPGFFTPTGVTRHDPLQKIVERRVLEDGKASPVHPEFRNLRFALVDLTQDKSKPQFAGHRETEQGGLGSMAKMACMYAAYQLKFDLETIAKEDKAADEKALFEAARKRWSDTQKRDAKKITHLLASKPKINLFGKLVEIDGDLVSIPRPFSSPDLERIFTFFGGSLRFIGSDKVLVDLTVPGAPPHTTAKVESYLQELEDEIKRLKEQKGDHTGDKLKYAQFSLKKVRDLTFAERLLLMIDDSDNAATHSCIENVSFLYIASALWQSDLYSLTRGGGLWEARTHDEGGVTWMMPPVPPRAGNPGVDAISATAASVAGLLTLLEQDRLVNKDAAAAMKQLTSKKKVGLKHNGTSVGSYTRSYFKEGLSGITFDRFHSKLGIGSHLNDCAIVVRTAKDPKDAAKSKQLRYVAAGFDEPMTGDPLLAPLMEEFDKCIRENNGLLKDTDP